MTPDRANRPRQVAIGAILAAFGGLLLVIGLYDTLGSTQSSEVRRQLEETLAEPPASGLGLEVDQALTLMRGLITVLAVAGGLSVVFGIFTFLGDRRSRWGLLACAVVVFVGSPLAMAGLLGLGVTLGTILVFSGPGRDWFAGRPIRDLSRSRAGGTPRTMSSPPGRSTSGDAASTPSATAATSSAVTHPAQSRGAAEAGGDAGARPRAVTEACVATWIGSGVATLLCAALLAVTALAGDVLVERLAQEPELQTLGVDAETAVTGVVVLAVIGLVWSLAAALLALGAWRGSTVTAVLLAVSAGVTVLVGLLSLPLGLINAGLGAFALARLLRRDARAWIASD